MVAHPRPNAEADYPRPIFAPSTALPTGAGAIANARPPLLNSGNGREGVMLRPDATNYLQLCEFSRSLAEREGFEPSVQVLARTTV
jgi:hypothetical protein